MSNFTNSLNGMLRERKWLAVACASVLTPVHGQNYTFGLSSEMAYASDISLIDSEMFVRRRDTKREVTLFLLKDCCGGRSDVCAPLIAELTPCCTKAKVDD